MFYFFETPTLDIFTCDHYDGPRGHNILIKPQRGRAAVCLRHIGIIDIQRRGTLGEMTMWIHFDAVNRNYLN